MLKPGGPICNLDCSYCYYLSKERLYPGSEFRMNEDLLEDFTLQYIKAQNVPEVIFTWQGGEPLLMGLEFFQRAVELQRKYCLPGMQIHNSLQTNGIPIDKDWCHFFRENGFLLGVSLDGPADRHDAYRRDKSGGATFEKVMAGISLLEEYWVDFNILTCIHAANAEHPLEVYRFLRDDIGAKHIQFIPVVECDNATGYQEGNRVTDRSVNGKQYGDFLITIFDEWVQRDVGHVFVQMFDVALAGWVGERPGLCLFDEVCGTALVMEHNGDLYSCDHFVEPEHLLGNIRKSPLSKLVNSAKQRKFGSDKRDALPGCCLNCEMRFICNGGCPKNRFIKTPEGESGLNFLCEGYKAFFRHVDPAMRFMKAELQAGRPPANIMLNQDLLRGVDALMPTDI